MTPGAAPVAAPMAGSRPPLVVLLGCDRRRASAGACPRVFPGKTILFWGGSILSLGIGSRSCFLTLRVSGMLLVLCRSFVPFLFEHKILYLSYDSLESNGGSVRFDDFSCDQLYRLTGIKPSFIPFLLHILSSLPFFL